MKELLLGVNISSLINSTVTYSLYSRSLLTSNSITYRAASSTKYHANDKDNPPHDPSKFLQLISIEQDTTNAPKMMGYQKIKRPNLSQDVLK